MQQQQETAADIIAAAEDKTFKKASALMAEEIGGKAVQAPVGPTTDAGDSLYGILQTSKAFRHTLQQTIAAAEQATKAHLAKVQVQTFVIETAVANGDLKKVEVPAAAVHPNFSRVIKAYQATRKTGPAENQWWSGPAGSGKTTLAAQVAEALGLKLLVISISRDVAEYHLLGYCSPTTGMYIPGLLAPALAGGKWLVLLDECDRGTDSALVALNRLADQREVLLPNGEHVKLSDDVFIVATGNTWGRGADALYTAATNLDAAFLSRFPVKLAHDYDEKFEQALFASPDFTKLVQRVRKTVFELGLQVVISPRISRAGGKLVAAGYSIEEAANEALWPELPPEQCAAVKQRMGLK